jgi:hypothetical protein
MAATRQDVNRLLDALPESEMEAIARYIQERQALIQKVREIHRNAPVDDEPLTARDIAAMEKGLADVRAGNGVPLEDVLAEDSDRPRTGRRRS